MRGLPLLVVLVLVNSIPLQQLDPDSIEDSLLTQVHVQVTDQDIKNGISEYFIENKGQIRDDEALFYYTNNCMDIILYGDGIKVMDRHSEEGLYYRMDMDWAEGSSGMVLEGKGPVLNYIKGRDPSNWVFGARTCKVLWLEDVTPGISLKVYLTDNGPKWDLVLERASMLEDISLKYTGNYERMDSYDEYIEFQMGERSLIEGPFELFQNGKLLRSRVLKNDELVKFQAWDLDLDSELIIDPLMTSSTFLGGDGWDTLPEIQNHPTGDIVIGGTVESADLQTREETYDEDFNGDSDIFVCRLTPDLRNMTFGTYFGGLGKELMKGMKVDKNGSIFIAGSTTSTDLPVSPDAYMGNHQGGEWDSFILQLSSELDVLNFSTYIGGSSNDWASGMSISENGIPFICGTTESEDLPVTYDCYQDEMGGVGDTYIAKLHLNGSGLYYLTYLGGTGFGLDRSYDIKIDSKGRAIVAGYSGSGDFPTTEGAFKRGNGGNMGFISRLSQDGKELNMSTYLALGTEIYSITLDMKENIISTGRTRSENTMFPVSFDAYDRDLTGDLDCFITKMDPNGTRVIASTYLGADEMFLQPPEVDFADEYCSYVNVDRGGNIIATGGTESYNFPLTLDTMDNRRDLMEAFVVKFDSNLTSLQFSTFIGSYDMDRGSSVLVDDMGFMYLAGDTYNDLSDSDFPSTVGAYQPIHSNQYDWFCMKFNMDLFVPGPPMELRTRVTNNSINLTWEPPVFDGNSPVIDYYVYWGNREPAQYYLEHTTKLWFNHTDLKYGKTYYYSIRANNSIGRGYEATISDTTASVPSAILFKTLVAGDSHVNLSWYPPWNPGATGPIKYELRWGKDPSDLDNVFVNISGLWFDVQGLKNGQKYFFQIFARNRIGLSNGSQILNRTPYAKPSSPRNFSIEPKDKAAVLEWDPPSETGGYDEILYDVHRYLGENYTSPEALNYNGTSLRVMPLINGNRYTYFVIAKNAAGQSERTGLVSVVPFGPVSEPWELKGEEHGRSAYLMWERPMKTGGFVNITYSILMGPNPSSLEVIFSGILSENYTIYGLTPGEEYYFAVMAFNDLFNSSLSNIISLRPMELPTAPKDLVYETGNSYINMSWREPEYYGGDRSVKYTLYLGTSYEVLTFEKQVSQRRLNLTELVNGQIYFIGVKAINSKGEGPLSNVINATPMKVPSVPQFFKIKDGDRSLSLSWERPIEFGGAIEISFNIYFGESERKMNRIEEGFKGTQYDLTDLVNGRTYYIGITAFNSKGESTMVGPLMAIPMTYPGPPEDLVITVEKNGIHLKWNPPLDKGGSEIWFYHIERTDEIGNNVTFTLGGHQLEYIDEDVKRGNEYCYRVTAESSYGKGEPSPSQNVSYPEKDKEEGIPILALAMGFTVLVILIIVISFLFMDRRKKIDIPAKQVIKEE